MNSSQNGSGKRGRRHFTGQQKAAIVKAHLVDGVSISELCDKHQIQPTQFYRVRSADRSWVIWRSS